MLNGLDLFSGIGGLTLALDEWVRPIAYCENDQYASAVLFSRMHEGLLPLGPIWDDVRTLEGKQIIPKVDIITAGFPCQDLSAAGLGRGLAGERSGLYFEIERLVRETKPTFVFLENVPAIRTRGLGRVVWGLSELGYDLRWTVVSAAEVGAPHLRKRWWLLAHGNGSLADADGARLEKRKDELCDVGAEFAPAPQRDGWWAIEPDVGRVFNGVPARVDRLKCLGNSVVPAQATEAFKRLMGIE